MKEAIIFGAGNIGRGFIGQLFSESGYFVTFVDIDQPLLDAINRRSSYTIRLATNERVEDITVGPVRGLHTGQIAKIAEAISQAEIGATAVGVRALPMVAPLVAAGVCRRFEAGKAAPLNLIICENLKDAAAIFHSMVGEGVPASAQEYFAANVGFVDTVIGRMVPPPTPEMRQHDPSLILVEPYKELPVDRRGFIGQIPAIVSMEACDNFPAYTARKLYLHNCGHACLAYLGHRRGHTFGYQALVDPAVRPLFEQALGEAKRGIVSTYNVQATWLEAHIADLIGRFANRTLGDTIVRLGHDPLRKLAPNDRLVGAARLVEKAGVTPDALSWGIAAGYTFDHPEDPLAAELQGRLAAEGLDVVMREVSGIQPDEPLAALVRARYHKLIN